MADIDQAPDAEDGGDGFPQSTPFSEISGALTGASDAPGQPENEPEPGAGEPEPTARPVKARGQEKPEREPTGEPLYRPEASTPEPASTEQTITVRGKKYTVAELQSAVAKDPQLAIALGTTHEQFNLTREQLEQERQKRIELLERRAAQPAEQPPAEIDPLARKAEIVRLYGPRMGDAVQKEGFNADFVQDYPDLACTMRYYQDVIMGMGVELLRLKQAKEGDSLEQTRASFNQAHDQAIDTLAGRDNLYSGLMDAAHRTEFKKYIAKLDPADLQLTLDPDELEGMYLAFSRPTVREALRAGSTEHAARTDRAATNARGPGRSVRGGGRPGTEPTDANRSNFEALLSVGAGR